MIDPKTPSIAINKNDKGAYVVTVYGAVAHWPRIQDPEPVVNKDKTTGAVTPVTNKDGSQKQKWSVALYLPKNAPGVKDLNAACVEVRKNELKGLGKIAAMKDGDRELTRLVEEMGKDPEKLQHMVGQAIISASTTIAPIIHNEIYAGAVCAAVIQLASYDLETKGVKAYLQEIGRVAPGERLATGGQRASVLAGAMAFEADSAPATPHPSTSAPAAAGTDGMPWED